MVEPVDFAKEREKAMSCEKSMFPEKMVDAYARRILESNGKGAHTHDHSRRVLRLCMEVGQKLGANLRVLCAAALLHDIGRPFERELGKSHSVISGEMSREFLKDIGYNEDEIQGVVEAIRTHRFSEGLEPTSLEGKILSDADKLDAMGAVGVFRSIAQASVSGTGITGFINHAYEKLLKLRSLLYTDVARHLADERHELLKKFVERLREEASIVE